jgi:hypothetical protein
MYDFQNKKSERIIINKINLDPKIIKFDYLSFYLLNLLNLLLAFLAFNFFVFITNCQHTGSMCVDPQRNYIIIKPDEYDGHSRFRAQNWRYLRLITPTS